MNVCAGPPFTGSAQTSGPPRAQEGQVRNPSKSSTALLVAMKAKKIIIKIFMMRSSRNKTVN